MKKSNEMNKTRRVGWTSHEYSTFHRAINEALLDVFVHVVSHRHRDTPESEPASSPQQHPQHGVVNA